MTSWGLHDADMLQSTHCTVVDWAMLVYVTCRGYTRKEPFANNFLGLNWSPQAENWNVSPGIWGVRQAGNATSSVQPVCSWKIDAAG
jgi:hypothetical protein